MLGYFNETSSQVEKRKIREILRKYEFVGDKKVTEEIFRKSDTLEGLKRNINVIMSFQVKNHVLVM